MAAIHGSCSSGIAMSAIRANDNTTTCLVTGRAFTLVVTRVEAASGWASQATVDTHSSRSSASRTGRGSVCGSGTGTGQPNANERASSHSISAGDTGRAASPAPATIRSTSANRAARASRSRWAAPATTLPERGNHRSALPQVDPVVDQLVGLGAGGHVHLIALHQLARSPVADQGRCPNAPEPNATPGTAGR